jgi:hypothetical protein
MQIIGDRSVRVVPDVAVCGNGSGAGLIDGLLGMMVQERNGKKPSQSQLKSPPPAAPDSYEQLPLSQSSHSVPDAKPSKPTPHSHSSASTPDIPFKIEDFDIG